MSTANDIDIHEEVASKMKEMMQTSTRFVPANIGLVAVSRRPHWPIYGQGRDQPDFPTPFVWGPGGHPS